MGSGTLDVFFTKYPNFLSCYLFFFLQQRLHSQLLERTRPILHPEGLDILDNSTVSTWLCNLMNSPGLVVYAKGMLTSHLYPFKEKLNLYLLNVAILVIFWLIKSLKTEKPALLKSSNRPFIILHSSSIIACHCNVSIVQHVFSEDIKYTPNFACLFFTEWNPRQGTSLQSTWR